MTDELEEYRRQFAAIARDTERLLSGLTEQQIEWRESPATWSIADCLNHLVVTGRQSLAHIHSAVADARSRGVLARGPFRHSLLGNWFVRLMDAPARIRFKVPDAYRPAPNAAVSEIVASFVQLQRELVQALQEADGIDLARVKVNNPVSDWFKMSLGQEFALTAAHERRHLLQASRVRQKIEEKQGRVVRPGN